MRKDWIRLGLMMATLGFAPFGPRAQWKTPWSYEGDRGPERWGDLDPAYATCRDGKEQSPIDIRDAKKTVLPALRFEFKSGLLKIINNGYTAVRVNYGRGNGNFLTGGDKRYELAQFHFHHPSEETVHGKAYAMVAHFMLQADDGRVAGVAVFLRPGRPNATVQRLWEHMPMTEGQEREIPGVEVNPAGLLPRDVAYYRYEGSVTAPPCTEGVTWFVLKKPVEISSEQIRAFAQLYPHDVRPVQPLHDRVVQESQ